MTTPAVVPSATPPAPVAVPPVVRDVPVLVGRRALAGARGERGPAGTPGKDGRAARRFVHVQATPAAVWFLEHGFGEPPASVRLLDEHGEEVDADLLDVSPTVTTVSYPSPRVGRAILT